MIHDADRVRSACLERCLGRAGCRGSPKEPLDTQVFVDLGPRDVVFTIWTKNADADLAAVADALMASVAPGQGDAASPLAFRIDGAPVETFAEAMAGDALDAAVMIDVVVE